MYKSRRTGFAADVIGKRTALHREHLRRNRLLASAVLALTIISAYASADVSPNIFICLVPFFLLQVFATIEMSRLVRAWYQEQIACHSMRSAPFGEPLLVTIGLTIYDTYFVLFLCFDTSWLLKSLLHPVLTSSWSEYLERLSIGPIPGIGFIIF